MSKGADTQIAVLEYDRVEDAIEESIRLREQEIEASDLADSAGVDISTARTVLEHLSQQYACLRPLCGDTYEIVLPEQRAGEEGDP
jgi:ribosomal protein S25